MSLSQKRYLFLTVWVFLLVLGPLTVFLRTPVNLLSDSLVLINFLQRIFGLILFTLLFSQIMIGSHMFEFVNAFGGWVHKFHIAEGVFSFFILLLHPLMQLILDFKFFGLTSALLVLLPGRDLYLNFGKFGFYLLLSGIAAAYFRTKPFLRNRWRSFHQLNYFAFFFVAFHAWGKGSDVRSLPFIVFYFAAVTLVSYVVSIRAFKFVKRRFSHAF